MDLDSPQKSPSILAITLLCVIGARVLGGETASACTKGLQASRVDELNALEDRAAAILGAEPPSAGDPVYVLGRRLAELGPDAIPIFLRTLEAGSLEQDGVDPLGKAPLDAVQESALLSALGSFGRERLLSHLEDRLDTLPGRLVVLRILGRFGGREDLALAVRAASLGEEDFRGGVSSALQEAVELILRRDPDGHPLLGRLIFGAQPHVAFSLVRGTALAGSPRGFEVLTNLLGWDQDVDLLLLTQIGRLADVVLLPANDQIMARVRQYLRVDDVQLLREAAVACGKLEDFEAVELLVGLLEHERESVREASRWSLNRMTGMKLSADATRWESWWNDSGDWFEDTAPRLFSELTHPDRARVVYALNELSARRFRRDRIAEWMVAVLKDPRSEIRQLGCAALGRLGSSAAIPALLPCLADPDERVVREAWTALKLITGRDLPAQAEAWVEVLDPKAPGAPWKR